MTIRELDMAAEQATFRARETLRALLPREAPPFRIKRFVEDVVEAASHRAEARIMRRLLGQAEADAVAKDVFDKAGLGARLRPDADVDAFVADISGQTAADSNPEDE